MTRRKASIAWIALVAVLYAAASPVLAALSFQAHAGFTAAICTLDGAKPVSEQPAAPAGNNSGHQQYCVFCVSGAWQPPVDVSLTIPAPAASDAARYLARDAVLPYTSAAFRALSPRAPPRLV